MERHAELGMAQRHMDDPRSKKGRKVWFALESSVKQSQAGSVYLQTMQQHGIRCQDITTTSTILLPNTHRQFHHNSVHDC